MVEDAAVSLSGTNLTRAADHNQRVTLHTIRVNGPITRVEISAMTGLTPPTIANITKRLLADGLILNVGQRRGGRGQPATRISVNPEACYSIGVNIDRDHITFVIVNFLAEIVARRSFERDFALPADVRTLFLEQLPAMVREADIDAERLVGIGVAIPDELGHIDLPGRPATYDEWDRTDMAALFSGLFDVPVFWENDAAAAAMGEQQLGLGQTISSFFYILISAALGGGLVVSGTYFRGAHGRSGELGFIMGEDGNGGRQQIQNFVSLSGLGKMLEACGSSIAALRADRLDPAAHAVVEQWIDRSATMLVDTITSINCLIDPAAILIGGRLPERYVDRLAHVVSARLHDEANKAPAMALIRRAGLAEEAPAVGAAILPFSHFLLPKLGTLWKTEATADAADGRSDR